MFRMCSFRFTYLLFLLIVTCVSADGDSNPSPQEIRYRRMSSPFLNASRSKRSPIPEPKPHHYRRKYYANYYYEPTLYVKPVAVALPIVKPVLVKPVLVKPVVVKPAYVSASPVSSGCYSCYKPVVHQGGYSQASSQASSSSFSAGFNSPFGNFGFSGSSAQSSAQSGGNALYGK